MSTICVNTNREMHSLFVDSSVNNVLLQTLTSCFEFINFPKQNPINPLLHNTANIVEWTVIRADRGYISEVMKFTDVFFHFNSCCICSVFPGNAKTDVR